jgi:hypothetical protein
MQNVKFLLGISAGLLAAVAVACGSSSSPAAATHPDGGDDATTSGDDGSTAPPTCLPLGSTGCSKGQECCLDLSAGLAPGMCVAAGTCSKSNIAIGCEKTADCVSSQVCCASVGGIDAGALAALAEGGLGALGIDASALSADAGAAALGGLNISLDVACASSCSMGEIQVCATNADCTGGATCVPLSMLTGDAGGALGDAGLPAGLSMYASALGMVGACVTPPVDSGTTPPVDSGMEDVVVPTDAPADAPAE